MKYTGCKPDAVIYLTASSWLQGGREVGSALLSFQKGQIVFLDINPWEWLRTNEYSWVHLIGFGAVMKLIEKCKNWSKNISMIL